MIRFFAPLLAVLLLFSCCKSNEKAYQVAFEKMKEKDNELVKMEQADLLADTSEKLIKRTTPINLKIKESVTVVSGNIKNLSRFNIVLKNFINHTNAKSLYDRMVKEGHPAVLVQNNKQEYRVIVESCKYEFDADRIAKELKNTWPDVWILVRY